MKILSFNFTWKYEITFYSTQYMPFLSANC